MYFYFGILTPSAAVSWKNWCTTHCCIHLDFCNVVGNLKDRCLLSLNSCHGNNCHFLKVHKNSKKKKNIHFHEFSMTAQQNQKNGRPWLCDDLTLPIHLAVFVLTVMVFIAKADVLWCIKRYEKTSNMGASRPALMFDWIYGAMGCFWECSIQIRLTWLQG